MTAAHKYYSVRDFFISIFVQRANRKCR